MSNPKDLTEADVRAAASERRAPKANPFEITEEEALAATGARRGNRPITISRELPTTGILGNSPGFYEHLLPVPRAADDAPVDPTGVLRAPTR